MGKCSGMLGIILRKAQNKIQDPAKLRRLIVVKDWKPILPATFQGALHLRRAALLKASIGV